MSLSASRMAPAVAAAFLCLFCCYLCEASTSKTVVFDVSPILGAESLESAAVNVILTDDSGKQWKREARIGHGGSFELPEDAQFPLKFGIEQAGWWASPVIVPDFPGPENNTEIAVWQTGRIVLPVMAVGIDGDPQPLPEARALFCGCLDETGEPTPPCGEVPVTLDLSKGKYRFELPAGCRDLEILTEEFSGVTFDRISVTAQKTVTLETAVLSRGGSVRGRIVDSSSGRGIPDAKIEVKPQFLTCQDRVRIAGESQDEPEPVELASRVVRSTFSSYRGRFRLTGLEPGTYELHFSKEKYADRVIRDVPARPQSEYELRDVELGPGATVEVYSSSMPCEGEPLTVVLAADQGNGKSVGNKPLTFQPPADRAVFSAVAPGRYTLRVKATCGALRPRVLSVTPLEVMAGDYILFPVELDLPSIRGRVESEGQSVAATIRLEPLDVIAEAIELESSQEEGFVVTLPGAGVYRASVSWSSGKFTEDLVVDGNEEELVIEVPEVFVGGVVKNPDGDPVGGAIVTAREKPSVDRLRPPKVVTATSDDDGRFEFQHLSVGEWVFEAELDENRSRPRTEQLSGFHQKVTDLELTLEELDALSIFVVSSNGLPVEGAKVRASWRSLGGSGPLDTSQERFSDPEGRIELSLPARVTEIRLLATAPGFAATWARFRTGAQIVLRIPENGGFLEFRRSEGSWAKPGIPTVMLVFQGGVSEAREPMWTLHRGNIEPTSEGRSLIIGPIAQGQYGVLILEDQDDVARLWQSNGQYPPDMVVSVFVGQSTTVDLPF